MVLLLLGVTKPMASFNAVAPSKGSREKKLNLDDKQKKLGKRAFQQAVPQAPFNSKQYLQKTLARPFKLLWAMVPPGHNDHLKGARWRAHAMASLCPFLKWVVRTRNSFHYPSNYTLHLCIQYISQ